MAFDMRMPGTRHTEQDIAPEPDRHEEAFFDERSVENRDYHSFRAGKAIIWWESVEHAPEFLKSKKAYAVTVLAIVAIVGYALFTDSPLTAIVFILIGMVGYLLFNRPPETVMFAISDKGVTAGREFYDYDNIESFWIVEEEHPQFQNHLIIHVDSVMSPRVHIPLEDNDPETVRNILLDHVPEIKYDPGIVDTIERMFHI